MKTLTEILASSPLENAPETCFHIEGPSGDKYRIRGKKQTKKQTSDSKARKLSQAERVQLYAAMVERGEKLPVLPEYEEIFNVDEN